MEKRLSVYQQKILHQMRRDGLVLVTSEGKFMKAWLETRDRKYVTGVNIRSALAISRLGLIKPLSDEEAKHYPSNLFPWKLVC